MANGFGIGLKILNGDGRRLCDDEGGKGYLYNREEGRPNE